MKRAAYCLFETPLGACGLGWTESATCGGTIAVACLQLPEATPKATEQRVARKSGGSKADAPPAIAEVIVKIQQHLSGKLRDFHDVPLDLSGTSEFDRLVYQAALRIPPGETTTYGELARAVGRPTEARGVGQALARNPIPIIIPCHRVLAAGGKFGGFSAPGALLTKTKLLAIERATFTGVLPFPA